MPTLNLALIRSKKFFVYDVYSKNEMKYHELPNTCFNGEKYRLFLKNFMDNCYFIIDYGHCILYLPLYSPFLNPIENAFSKWKIMLERKNIMMKMIFLSKLMMT